jgi:hypothetical protein
MIEGAVVLSVEKREWWMCPRQRKMRANRTIEE